MKLTTGVVVAAMVLVSACAGEPASGARTAAAADLDAIKGVLDRYVMSVNAADTTLAREVWAEGDAVGFIHPLGHERGWPQIKTNFYEKLMGGMFSARALTLKNVAVQPYGDAAVAEFDWEFNATLKDGSPLKTEGRETDVFVKDAQGAWRLAHAHYSGMPPPANAPPGDPSRGF